METGRFVNWSANAEEFNRFVEALIERKWSGHQGCRAYPLDGRGGDDGIDVAVERGGLVFHIYQLKFFPEGMSGGWTRRRNQVSRSFSKVADRLGLEEWTLVTPRNPTHSELRFIRGLKGDRAITIHVWGRSDLDHETAQHRDLLGNFTRRPVVDAVRDMAQESAALVRPQDLPGRLSKLFDLAESRSLYWATTFTAEPGRITLGLTPKRPDAAKREPLTISFSPSFRSADEPLRQQFEKLLAFGGTDTVELPAEIVGPVRLDGPEWFAHDSSDARMVIRPEILAEGLNAELRVVDANDALLASLRGMLDAFTRGDRGFTLKASFGGVELVAQHEKGVGGTLAVRWKLSGLPATHARTVLRMHRHLHASQKLQIWVDGARAMDLTAAQVRGDGAGIPQDAFDLVDDLAALTHAFDVEFTVPDEMTELDRIDVRVARHLVEGKSTYSPRIRTFQTTLNDEVPIDDESLRPFKEAVAAFVRLEDASLDVLGRKLPLGTLCAYHPAVTVRDPSHHLAAVRSGRAQGRKVTFEPTGDIPIRLWLADRWTDPNGPISITPWGINGIREPLVAESD